jgi:hypothetical protein
MVYDGVNNPAAWRCYPGAFSHCCADSYACTCGYAYSRADTDTHSYTHYHAHTTARVNGYACSYSYCCTYAHANPDANANTCAHGDANSGFEFVRSYCIYGLLKWRKVMLLGLFQHFHHECQWNWYYSVDADYKQVRLPI